MKITNEEEYNKAIVDYEYVKLLIISQSTEEIDLHNRVQIIIDTKLRDKKKEIADSIAAYESELWNKDPNMPKLSFEEAKSINDSEN